MPSPMALQTGTLPMAAHLMQILRMLEGSLPIDQVIHSLHTQALMDPEVRSLPAMERFSQVGDDHIHAKIAVAGYIRRMLSGDTSDAVAAGLREQLQAMARTHAEARSALTQLMGAEPARENQAVLSLSQVMPMADQAVRSLTPLLQPLMAVEAPAARQEA